MATKTISITEEAYWRLKDMMKENESFSRVINRITGKHEIMKLVGILSKEKADKIEKNIMKARKLRNKADKKRLEELRKAFK
jgi:predicted CopG family antitoxin